MDDAQFLRCQDLIARRMGYSWRQQDIGAVRRTLDERITTLRCSGVDEYLTLLNSTSPASTAEWKQLFVLLTNQESYFFRDQGQFSTLREHVFPEIIRRNQPTKEMRIWSAGCSTGEEPYSLAMLLDQILPFRSEWRVNIIGTDLSEAALQKARLGVYSAWSFRNVPADLRSKYFEPKGRDFQLQQHIRRMVNFAHSNLIADPFPNPQLGLFELDLIICRNVFIYFKRDAVGHVVQKFGQTLKDGGFLITGHAEVHDVPMREFETRNFPSSVVYCKGRSAAKRPPSDRPTPASPPARATARTSPPKPVAPPASRSVPPSPKPSLATTLRTGTTNQRDNSLDQARTSLRRGDNPGALRILTPLLDANPRDIQALSLAARAHADSGAYDKALSLCQTAREADPSSVLPLHVMASIADEKGQYSEAKELLKKVIYLAPEFVLPYVELSAIYDREGEKDRAKTMRQAAIRILKPHAPDSLALIDPLGIEPRVPAGQLLADLEGAD